MTNITGIRLFTKPHSKYGWAASVNGVEKKGYVDDNNRVFYAMGFDVIGSDIGETILAHINYHEDALFNAAPEDQNPFST